MSPFEAVLRRIAAVAPEPWYPRAFAKERGAELDGLTYLLEHLWLDGLIQNAPPVEGLGAGVVLSPEGERVLQDPDALERLREGRPLSEGDRGGVVRQALRRAPKPVVTRLLVGLNVLAFGYGAYLAWGRGALRNYLSGFSLGPRGLVGLPGLLDILHQTGSVTGADVLAGQWWRLLSSAFVHLGLIHLGMNMYILYRAGPMIEQMWGRLRYLAIYVISAWLGGCLAIAYGPRVLYQGASGAICGLLAAEAVWIVLNRRYIPGSVLRRARTAIFVNTLLLVAISLVGGVSSWGHGGGALGGALAAVLLNFQRFGPSPWRWLALPALAAVPALGVYAIRHQQAVNPQWQALGKAVAEFNREKAVEKEEQELAAAYDRQSEELLRQAMEYQWGKVEKLREMHPTRRPQAEVDAAIQGAADQRNRLAPLIERLAKVGPFQSAGLEKRRRTALELARDTDRDLQRGADELRQGVDRARKQRQEEAEQRFEKTYLRRIRETTRGADDVYHEQARALLEQRPARRAPAAVEKALKALGEGRAALDRLGGELAAEAPTPSQVVEEARGKAQQYLKASSQLLEQAQSALRAGERWTAKDEEALRKQAEAVEKLRKEWNEIAG